MYSSTIEPFEVAAVIEQEEKNQQHQMHSQQALEADAESSAPLLNRPSTIPISSPTSSSTSSTPRPPLSRRSSLSSFLDSLSTGVDSTLHSLQSNFFSFNQQLKSTVQSGVQSVKSNVNEKIVSPAAGMGERVKHAKEGAQIAVKEWKNEMKHNLQSLIDVPNSLVCDGCARELAIPKDAFKWICSKGHENHFIDKQCTHQEPAFPSSSASDAASDAANAAPSSPSLSPFQSVTTLCNDLRPSNLEWPKVQCPFSNCSHITPIPRTQAAAILRAGVTTFSSSVSSLASSPSTLFHCGRCNTLLAVPEGDWQCQSCTTKCDEAEKKCKACGQEKNDQKLLCGLCKHSTSIPSSTFSDSIRSSLKSLKEEVRKLSFTAVGQRYCSCPYCNSAQPITDEMLGWRTTPKQQQQQQRQRRQEQEQEKKENGSVESRKEEATASPAASNGGKHESSHDSQIKSSLSSSASASIPAPTVADADLLLATSSLESKFPSTLFSLSDEPIQCQLCSNSFYILYGKDDNDTVNEEQEKKPGMMFTRRRSMVENQTRLHSQQQQQQQEQQRQQERQHAAFDVEYIKDGQQLERDTEDLFDKLLSVGDEKGVPFEPKLSPLSTVATASSGLNASESGKMAITTAAAPINATDAEIGGGN